MKANELRIGNLVYRTNKLTKEKLTIELTASCILYISANGEISSFIYEPIPLTEEWLTKFGFKEHDFEHIGYVPETYHRIESKIGYMVIDSQFEFTLNYGGEYSSEEIKNVHQLQNLYFALTGEELTIKK